MRLSAATLADLPAQVRKPCYDVADQAIGIVHLGIGAFHRAHQAVYTDDAMNAGERDWRICGVSLRSGGVRDQLGPQDGFYSVTVKDRGESETRVIGSVAKVLVAGDQPDGVIGALANAATRMVTLTVTEKGYHLTADGGLDVDDPAIAEELRSGDPATIYGFLAKGLAARRVREAGGLTLLSCDNLAANGRKLQRALLAYLEQVDPELERWTSANCTFPCSMVDRIVPATTPDDLDAVARTIGMDDAGAVVTERFSQWVIEDRFATGRPRWEDHGAQIVADVEPYETAKLRMLNGAHSALAYLGLAEGLALVSEAVAHPHIGPLVDRLMRDEAASSFTAAPGQNLSAYADQLLRRFANPALPHRLAQIALDGSQKIPQRWLETLAHHQQRGRTYPAILAALAAWIVFVRGDGRHKVDDPMADRLATLWKDAGPDGIVAASFGPGGVFADHFEAGEESLTSLQALVTERLANRRAPTFQE